MFISNMALLRLLTIIISTIVLDLTVGKAIDRIGYHLVCPENEECTVSGHEKFDEDKLKEGDIIPDEKPLVQNRNALIDSMTRWPNRTVPYVFHKGFSMKEKLTIKKNMKFIESKTCVKFVPYDPDLPFKAVLMITNERGCRASIGYAKGRRIMNLSPNGCLGKAGKMHHEILHVLGLKHEHSRPDRDQYITILNKNIIPGLEHNFDKASPLEYTTYDVPYNFHSVMHYPLIAFSKDHRSPTLVPKVPVDVKRIGQRIEATAQDLKKINIMYNCPQVA